MKHVSIAQYICMLYTYVYVYISHHHSCLWVYQLTFAAPQRSLWHLQLNAISDADKRTTDGKCSTQRKCRIISHFHPFRFLMLHAFRSCCCFLSRKLATSETAKGENVESNCDSTSCFLSLSLSLA